MCVPAPRRSADSCRRALTAPLPPDSTEGLDYRTGWMCHNFVNPDQARTDALSDVPIDDWEFVLTPTLPEEVPVLFLWATEGFHSPELLEWGDGSEHQRMDGDHWFPTRGKITETNGAIARCIVNDLDDNEDIASTLCIQSDLFDDGGGRRLGRRKHDHKMRAPRQTSDPVITDVQFLEIRTEAELTVIK